MKANINNFGWVYKKIKKIRVIFETTNIRY